MIVVVTWLSTCVKTHQIVHWMGKFTSCKLFHSRATKINLNFFSDLLSNWTRVRMANLWGEGYGRQGATTPGMGGPWFHAFREPGMKTESGASGDVISYECGDLSLLKCSQGGCREKRWNVSGRILLEGGTWAGDRSWAPGTGRGTWDGGPLGEGGYGSRERERDHLVPNCMPIGDCHGLLMSSLSFCNISYSEIYFDFRL